MEKKAGKKTNKKEKKEKEGKIEDPPQITNIQNQNILYSMTHTSCVQYMSMHTF